MRAASTALVALVVASPSAVAESAEPRWCAPELEVLAGEVCLYTPRQAKERPTVLVIFLHSLVGRDTSWQWEQQRTMMQLSLIHI